MDDEVFDFGLDAGESFIPDDDEFVDRAQPHIMTVLGPIDPGSLGPVNLAASFVPRRADADLGSILTEIQEAAVVGLNALVDLRPIASEMEARAALWLAERCDIHLVVATGIDPDAGIAGNTRRLIDQAATGMFHTRVSPGVIVGRPEKQSIDAAMSGREATGLPAIIDARSSGPPPDLPVFELPMARMASASFAPDSWHGLFDLSDGVNPDLIAKLKQSVDDLQVLVGYDPDSKQPDRFSRWSWLIEEFPIELLEAGLDPAQVRALLVDAPAAFLTIEQPAPPRC